MNSVTLEMAPRFEPPSEEQQLRLIGAAEDMERSGQIFVRMTLPSDDGAGFPWEPAERHYNAFVTVRGRGPFAYSNEVESEVPGCGAGAKSLAGVCHAVSEAFERLLVVVGGVATVRLSPKDGVSILSGRKVSMPLDPLAFDRAPGSLYSTAGGAFHAVQAQALRAGLCEVLERHVVSGFLRGLYPTGHDVTEVAGSLFSRVARARTYFEQEGYSFKLLAIDNPWGVWVCVAAVLSLEPRPVRMAFRGFGADFGFEYAVNQALSELGRCLFLGGLKSCSDEKAVAECAAAQREASTQDVCLLTLPRFSRSIRPFIRPVKKLSTRGYLSRERGFEPQRTLRAMEGAGLDPLAIALAADTLEFPGYAFKVVVPGLDLSYPFLVV